MRLLYLSADPGIPILGDKGASVHVRAMVGALESLGHEVVVASPRVEAGAESLPAGAELLEIPAVRPRDCSTPGEVEEQISRQAAAVLELATIRGVEAVYERYSLASCAGARVSATLDVPLVLEVNAPLREEERRFRHLVHEDVALVAEWESFSAAVMIFAVSESLRTWLTELGVDERRVAVMGNAPPARSFTARPPREDQAPVVIGFAGGLRPWHGIDVLVAAFALALERGARIRLEIVGRGPADELLDRAELPRDRLKRHGHLAHQHALDVIESWDVGVAPYPPQESFYFSPLKLLEYMAAGLCPVVSDVGELAEVVEHGRTGLVVAPGDPAALADTFLTLDRDRDLLRRTRAGARAAAERRPSWRQNAQRVIQAIEAGRAVRQGSAQ